MNRYYTKNAYSPVNRTHGIGAQTAAQRPNRPVGEQGSTTRKKLRKNKVRKKGVGKHGMHNLRKNGGVLIQESKNQDLRNHLTRISIPVSNH